MAVDKKLLEKGEKAKAKWREQFQMSDSGEPVGYAEGSTAESRAAAKAEFDAVQQEIKDAGEIDQQLSSKPIEELPQTNVTIETAEENDIQMSTDEAVHVEKLRANAFRMEMLRHNGVDGQAALKEFQFSDKQVEYIENLPPSLRLDFAGGQFGDGHIPASERLRNPPSRLSFDFQHADAVSTKETVQTGGGTLGSITVPASYQRGILNLVNKRDPFVALATIEQATTGEEIFYRDRKNENASGITWHNTGDKPTRGDITNVQNRSITPKWGSTGYFDLDWDLQVDPTRTGVDFVNQVMEELADNAAIGMRYYPMTVAANSPIVAMASDVDADMVVTAANGTSQVTTIKEESMDLLEEKTAEVPLDRQRYMFGMPTRTLVRGVIQQQVRSTDRSAGGAPYEDVIHGIPYITNPSLPKMTAGSTVFFLGDFGAYVFRVVNNLQVFVDASSLGQIETRKTSYIGYVRMGGRLVYRNRVAAFKNAAS